MSALTQSELDNLPVGAAVVDSDGDLWTKTDEWPHCWGTRLNPFGHVYMRVTAYDLHGTTTLAVTS